MKFIKRFLFSLIALIVLLLIVGFFLPQQQHVERSISIAAPVSDVYKRIDSPKAFNEWSPWAKIDPQMVTEFSGPESGKGASMSWKSDHPNVGSGTWTITHATENKSVNLALSFEGQGDASSFFNLAPEAAGTKVTWGFDTDAGMNPIMRWFGLMLDKWVGADYEKGLNNLKLMLEKK